MSKQRILMILALCFVLIGTVAAGIPHEPKPESVVTCLSLGLPMGVRDITVSPSIDTAECPTGEQETCAPCIESLVNQGCEIVDLATKFIPKDFTNLPSRDVRQTATFLLSCASP
jgi:hypothetical protein